MCCHDLCNQNSTMRLLPQIKMVHPMQWNAQCIECGKIIKHISQETVTRYHLSLLQPSLDKEGDK